MSPKVCVAGCGFGKISLLLQSTRIFMKSNEDKVQHYLDLLNEQQLAAVRHTEGPSLIVAGAGSGKTTVLTTKIAYLISKGVPPWSVLALTFTNKAAREMRERIEAMVGVVDARSLWMGTFHSVFSRILRKEAGVFGFDSNFTIYQPSDTKALLKAILKERGLDEKEYKLSLLANRISEAKNRLVTPKLYKQHHGDFFPRDMEDGIPLFEDIYAEYFKRCHNANAMDFDDLLLYTYILFCNDEARRRYAEKFRYVLVDEYQDTNVAQFAILNKIVYDHKNICVVGDDAQSIYGFRGAQIDNILKFDKTYEGTKIFRLERNYRSTKTIVNAANSLIKKNKYQIQKNLYSENEEGSPIVLSRLVSDIEEGEMVCRTIKSLHKKGVKYADIAVLYRTNGQSRILEETMRKRNIPCVIFGSNSFYDQKEIRDVLAYLRLITNCFDEEALRRIINYPTRGIGNTTLEKVFKCAAEQETTPWNVVQQPDLYGLGVSNATKTKLQSFANMIKGFIDASTNNDAYSLGQKVLRETGLMALAQNDRSSEGREVVDNYSSLLSGMSQFVEARREQGDDNAVSLLDYLSEVSLLTDSDKDVDVDDAVRMMTIHIAKGLEFDVVFITGMEDGVFPVSHCISEREMEEERRLFFVAITRAKKKCYLSNAKSRFRFGKSDWYDPSPFLDDIDSKYIYLENSVGESAVNKINEYIDFGELSNRVSTGYLVSSKSGISHNVRNNVVPARPERTIIRPPRERQSSASVEAGNNAGLKVGTIVKHATFGVGRVEALEDSVIGKKALISFTNCGEKNLLLKYAKLEIVR